MDHLPLPHGAAVDVCDHIAETYDGGPFLTYPERSRFKELYSLFLVDNELTHVPLPDSCGHLLVDLEIFAQTWCFFGLLCEIFGNQAAAEMFVERVDNGRNELLSTACLASVIDAWVHKIREHPVDMQSKGEHYMSCISKIGRFLYCVVKRPIIYEKSILRAIAVLAETIEAVVRYVCKVQWSGADWRALRGPLGCIDVMVNQGWPRDAVELLQGTELNGVSTFIYLEKLQVDPRQVPSSSTHSQGTTNSHTIINPLHTHECSHQHCFRPPINVNRIQEILESQRIALLDLSDFAEQSTNAIHIVPFDSGMRYVAISHVWSEGMGNSLANSLPQCQLMYMTDMTRSILRSDKGSNTPLLVWLDTLCCPVSSEEHRNMCLEQMEAIYKNASSVLIISSALKHCQAIDLQHLEICARLLTAVWMTRLWTLQEGALARRLWVGLEDKPIDVDIVERSLRQISTEQLPHRAVSLHFLTFLKIFRSLMSAERKQGRNSEIADLRHALRCRRVTKPTDEPLCLATCLGLPQRSILKQESPIARMCEFWRVVASSEHQIPREIIFCRGERIGLIGFRWSPRSLLQQVRPLSRIKTPQDTAMLDTHGLHFSWPGCSMSLEMPLSANDRSKMDKMFLAIMGAEAATQYGMSHLPIVCRHSKNGWFELSDTSSNNQNREHPRLSQLLRVSKRPVVLVLSHCLLDLVPAHRMDGPNIGDYLAGKIMTSDSNQIQICPVLCGHVTKTDQRAEIMLEAGWNALKQVQNEVLQRPEPQDAAEPNSSNNLELEAWPGGYLARLRETIAKVSNKRSIDGYPLDQDSVFWAAMRIVAQECCEVKDDFHREQKWCVT